LAVIVVLLALFPGACELQALLADGVRLLAATAAVRNLGDLVFVTSVVYVLHAHGLALGHAPDLVKTLLRILGLGGSGPVRMVLILQLAQNPGV
jgi:hypothetical protein